MTTAFQPSAYQSTGFQIDGGVTGGPNNYTVTCSPGSYAYTGQSATILKSRIVSASTGAYTYTGNAATILRSHNVTASPGSYAYTGGTAALTRSRLVTASPGAYAYTGQAATITYTPHSGAYTVTCEPGAYVIAGQDAAITYIGAANIAGGYWYEWWKKKHKKPEPETIEEVVEFIAQEAPKLVEIPAKNLKKQAETTRKAVMAAKQLQNAREAVDRARLQLFMAEQVLAAARKAADEDEEDAILAMLL